MNRRSFLALVAGALSVKPRELERVLTKSANPIIPQWWNNWTAWDTINIVPNEPTNEETFFPPLPPNFLIRSIGAYWADDVRRSDIEQILETASVAVESDSLVYMNAPLVTTAFGHRLGGSRQPCFPVIAPKQDFRIKLHADALPIGAVVPIVFSIDGMFATTRTHGDGIGFAAPVLQEGAR